MLSTSFFASATFLAKSGSRFGLGSPGTDGREDLEGGGGGGADEGGGGGAPPPAAAPALRAMAASFAWISARLARRLAGKEGAAAGGAPAGTGGGRNEGGFCSNIIRSASQCAAENVLLNERTMFLLNKQTSAS